jgi:hypothetical protein
MVIVLLSFVAIACAQLYGIATASLQGGAQMLAQIDESTGALTYLGNITAANSVLPDCFTIIPGSSPAAVYCTLTGSKTCLFQVI